MKATGPPTEHLVAYTGDRPDLRALVPPTASRILDVGCASGELGAALKRANPAVHVTGIELDAGLARAARSRLDAVLEADVDDFETIRAQVDAPFDCFVCGDVLEHLVDPWTALRNLATLLVPGGTAIASVPNVGHYDTVVNLVFGGRWPYRDVGIHDRSHLRFFARRNIEPLFEQARLRIVDVRRKYRLVEQGHRLDRLAPYVGVPGLRNLLTFQYLVVARRD